MPPIAPVLCAAAAILGTLVAIPSLSPDVRALDIAGCLLLCAYLCFDSKQHTATRALVLLILIGAATNAWLRDPQAPPEEHRTARYAGTVIERDVAVDDASTQLVLALDRGPRVLATIRGDAPPPGTRVVVRGRLAPFDEARNPGEPSMRAIEAERGIDAQLDAAAVLSRTGAAPFSLGAWLGRAHDWASAELRARIGEPGASVVAGELWGERSALPPDLRSEFQETGTVHVLVTAGLHLGVVAALVAWLLAPFALPRALTCALIVAGVWLFVLWSGAQLPAERAATMATFALAARACGRATFSWNALAAAAIVLAFARPQSVASASFALSFSCVGAIFACAAPLERWIDRIVALPERVREALVLSIATQIGTWPLAAATFLQFTPYAVLANVAVVPCVGFTMILGLLQLAFAWCAPLAQAFANLNSLPLAWSLAIVRTLASLPGSTIPMTPAPAWCVALYDAAVVAAPLLWRRGAVTAALTGILLGAGFVLWPARTADARLRITVLDVGQADAIVVQTPGGHALLVDAGGRLERGAIGADSIAERVGERIVVPFLLRQGIHALDALLISHPHGEHNRSILTAWLSAKKPTRPWFGPIAASPQ